MNNQYNVFINGIDKLTPVLNDLHKRMANFQRHANTLKSLAIGTDKARGEITKIVPKDGIKTWLNLSTRTAREKLNSLQIEMSAGLKGGVAGKQPPPVVPHDAPTTKTKGKNEGLLSTRMGFWGAVYGARLVFDAITTPIKYAKDAEYYKSLVKKVLHDKGKELEDSEVDRRAEELHKAARDNLFTSQKAMMLDIYQPAGKAGISAKNLPEFGEILAKGARAIQMSPKEATEAVVKIMARSNYLEEGTPDKEAMGAAKRILDVITHLEARTPISEAKKIGVSWQRAVETFAQMGKGPGKDPSEMLRHFTLEDQAAMIATYSQLNIRPQKAAREMGMLWRAVVDQNEKHGFKDLIVNQGIMGYLEVLKRIQKLSDAERKPYGKIARGIFSKVAEKSGINLFLKNIEISRVSAGAVDREMGLHYKTYQYQLEATQKELLGMVLEMGEVGMDLTKWMLVATEHTARWSKEAIEENPITSRVGGGITGVGIAGAIAQALNVLGGWLLLKWKGTFLEKSLTWLRPIVASLWRISGLIMGELGAGIVALLSNPVGWGTLAVATGAGVAYFWDDIVKFFTRGTEGGFFSILGGAIDLWKHGRLDFDDASGRVIKGKDALLGAYDQRDELREEIKSAKESLYSKNWFNLTGVTISKSDLKNRIKTLKMELKNNQEEIKILEGKNRKNLAELEAEKKKTEAEKKAAEKEKKRKEKEAEEKKKKEAMKEKININNDIKVIVDERGRIIEKIENQMMDANLWESQMFEQNPNI